MFIMPWKLRDPTLASLFGVLLGSPVWRHSEGLQGLVVYVGKEKPEQFKKGRQGRFGGSMKLTESCNGLLIDPYTPRQMCK